MNDLIHKVSHDYALFMEGHLQALVPVNCDLKQFIKDHGIHIRRCVDNTSELWIDDRKIGTFSQCFVGRHIIFEFTK